MRIRTERAAGILSTSDGFAEFVQELPGNRLEYEFSFSCSVEGLARYSAFLVNIEIYRVAPEIVDDSLSVFDRIAKQEESKNPIVVVPSDLTRYLDNEQTRNFHRVSQAFVGNDFSPIPELGKPERVVEIKKLSERDHERGVRPIRDVVFESTKEDTVREKPIDRLREKESDAKVMDIDDIIKGTSTKPASSVIRQGQDSVSFVVSRASAKRIHVRERIVIPAAELALDSFDVVFSLVGSKGLIVENLHRRVRHNLLSRLKAMPLIPPKCIASFTSFGKTVVDVKQEDPVAQGFRVYRRSVGEAGRFGDDDRFEMIAERISAKGEGFIRIEDSLDTATAVLYRAFPIGYNGIGRAFSDSLILPTISHREILKHFNFVSFYVKGVEDYHLIIVNSVPEDAISFEIVRRDLTKHENRFVSVHSPVQCGKRFGVIEIKDKNVVEDHVYQYGCRLQFRGGESRLGAKTVSRRYSQVKEGLAKIEITAPRVVKRGSDTDVVFEISTNSIDELLKTLIRSLSDEDIRGVFSDRISAERDLLKQIIVHHVIRHDLTDGNVSDLGIALDGKISDIEQGRVLGVEPIKLGHTYVYDVTTYVRDPNTLFQRLFRELLDSRGRAYAFPFGKFRHPYTLRHATLLARNGDGELILHAENEFLLGDIVNSETFQISLAKQIPEITSFKARRVSRSKVALTWNVTGARERIDHFLITAILPTGTEILVGKAHGFGDGGEFEFIHFLSSLPLDLVKGLYVTYRIFPYFLDGKKGARVETTRLELS